MSEVKPPSDPFSPYAPSAGDPMAGRWMHHLLRRAAFGANQQRLDRLDGKSIGETLDWLFDYDVDKDPFGESLANLEGFVNLTQTSEVAKFWLFRMINSPNPLQERIALFWHGRLPSSGGKVEQGRLMHEQIQMFRKLGLKNYRELITALGHDGAMLIYLDGRSNVKGKPNENYARELMELFTLGIGNYTERDVQELARCFTGWRVQEENVLFEKRYFDDGEKEVLGKKGKFDSESVIPVILAHPAAAKYLAKNLLVEFVHPTPTDEHISHYAKRLVDEKWEMKPVLREMLSSRLFFSDWAYRSKIKSPVELAVGIALVVGGEVNPESLRQSCSRLGQSLCFPPNVKGWPGGEDWINANTILLRFNFAMSMSSQRSGNDFLRKTKWENVLIKNHLNTAEDLVDYYAKVLLDGEVPADAKAKFLEYMKSDRDPKKKDTDMMMMSGSETRDTSKLRSVIHLMMSLPQYQLA
jgi:uncharacterized protein (DUF1800 family)